MQINGENVSTATHGRTVQLIRNSGDAICLKIVTPAGRRAVLGGPRPSNSSVSARPTRQHRAQRAAASAKTPPRAAAAVAGHLPQLTSARSLPDLTAADDTPDHPRRQQNDASAPVQSSSVVDYRDRVLYELTNRLRPLPPVARQRRPPPSGSSSAQQTDSESTASDSRPHTKSRDESSPQRRPAPPPRGASLSGRRPAASSPTTRSTGSELKELLVVSGHTAGASPHAGAHLQPTPSTEARSSISGEHLVLPSQLKKLQRSPADNQGARQQCKGRDDCATGRQRPSSSQLDAGAAAELNDQNVSSVVAQQHDDEQRRLLPVVPKRPAPPPPSATRLTVPPANNGEVNFLVMAEEARKQYIQSKLSARTVAASKTADISRAVQADDKQRANAKRAHDHELQKAVNGMANHLETNAGSHFTANGTSMEQQHRPTSNELRIRTASSPQAGDKDLLAAGKTAVNDSPPLELLLRRTQQPGASGETSPTGPPPVVPPKRRPRHVHSSRAAVCNNETSDFANVSNNGTDRVGVLQSHVSRNELLGAELSKKSAAQENLQAEGSSEQDRKSNVKLARGKNVAVRRSGYSRLSADDVVVVNGDHQSTSGDQSRDDAGKIQQLLLGLSVSDVGVLPPPPDFAD